MISPQFAPFSAPNAPSIAVAPSIAIVPYVAIVLPSCLSHRCVAIAPLIRVILNGRFWVWRGCGAGAVGAQRRHGGHKGHASLKFEKDGHLTKRASSAPKLIADKNLRKKAQDGA